MRVGIDCRLPYYELGGISEYVRQLVNGLARIDSSEEYSVFHSRKDQKSYLPAGATNFKRKRLWTPSHHIYERWLISTEIFPHKIDIFHSPDFIPPRFGPKGKVITVHDLNFLFYPQYLSSDSLRYYAGQIEEAVSSADHILADSHHTRLDIIERLGVSMEKVTAIHLAANPSFQQPIVSTDTKQVKEKYNLPSEYVLFVGTISPRKNIKIVIQALAELYRQAKVKIPLVIVGKYGWKAEASFEDSKTESIRNQIIHLEGVSSKELIQVYHLANVLVMPSIYEGFGLPPLEAMQVGCPVISSNSSSLPEVIGEAGILVDPFDLEGWVAALQTILNDEALRTELIRKGKEQAQKFSWDKTATETLAIYRKVHADG